MLSASERPVDPYAEACRLYQSADLVAAERFCRQVLESAGLHAEALHLLGLIAFQTGRDVVAVSAMRGAIASFPQSARCYSNLGLAFNGRGQSTDAANCFRRALTLRPDYAEAHNNVGLICKRDGRIADAALAFRRAVCVRPDLADAHINLANILRKGGALLEAIARGRNAVRLVPTSVLACDNLGAALIGQSGEKDEAREICHRALVLQADGADTLANLGALMLTLDDPNQATTWYRRAFDLRTGDPVILCNLGTALLECGRPEAAEACYRDAVRDVPDDPEAHWLLSIALLTQGKYEEGWTEYEWRWRRQDSSQQPISNYPRPLWAGEPGKGGAIFLWPEQGYGDAIQFVRFVPSVVRRGWRVYLAVPKSLHRLFSTMRDVILVDEGDQLPEFDVHCPLLSLPHALGMTLETIPHGVPYLYVDPRKVAAWRKRLGGRLRVGIVWRGSAPYKRNRQRSISPDLFSRFLDIPGITVVNLQSDADRTEIQALRAPAAFYDAGSNLGDFADTAALLASLDLVVTVDVYICHLAGAIGVPTWTLIDFAMNWRWLRGRADTPWYPTMRLFTQPTPGDWESVADSVRIELAALARSHRTIMDRVQWLFPR